MASNYVYPFRASFLFCASVFFLIVSLERTLVSAQQPASKINKENEVALDPRLKIVNTGLIAQRVEADVNGRFACVFGQLAPESSATEKKQRRSRGRTQLYGGPTHVAIVDLKSYKVIARQAIDGGIQQAFVGNEYLFWKPNSVNVINRLSLTATPELKQLPLQVAVQQMFFVGDDRIALIVSEGKSSQVRVYDRKSLTRLPDDPLSQFGIRNTGRRNYGTVANYLGDAELHLSPRLLDLQSGQTKCLVGNLGLPLLAQKARPSSRLVNSARGNAWWRRRYSGQQVQLIDGAILFRTPSRIGCVSKKFPLFASLVLTGMAHNAEHIVVVREVGFGKKVDQILWRTNSYSGVPIQNGMKFSGCKVVWASHDELAIFKLDSQKLKVLVEPFRLLHPLLAVSSIEDLASFQLVAKGGKPPYHYYFEDPIEGVSVDELTGKLSIDFPTLWKNRIEKISQGEGPPFQSLSPTNSFPKQPRTRTTRGEIWQGLFGMKIPPGMQPTAVPLTLTAMDSAGQRDEIFAQAIALAPKQEMEEANAAAAAIRAAKYAEGVAEMKAKQGGSASKSIPLRLDELEKRTRRIEAQLDTILRKLDKKIPGS